MEFKDLQMNGGNSLETLFCPWYKKGEYQGRGIGRGLAEALLNDLDNRSTRSQEGDV